MKSTDNEIEVIDIFDQPTNNSKIINDNIEYNQQNNEEDKKHTSVKVKRKLKKSMLFQTIFCFISIVFIVGCCIFYGSRLIKYYNIYNPKDSSGKTIKLFADSILESASFVYEGDGLYNSSGNYIYKGENVNNYIKYSNLTWRILKINNDKSIDIILDQAINNLKWNKNITDFNSSDINLYLNEKVLPILNEKLITNTIICKDLIDDISKVSCSEPDSSNKIRLLNIDEFLNSSVNDKSFVSNGNDIWLSSRGSKNVWTINKNSLSYAESINIYDIKPVVTLKNSNVLLSGSGTKEDPYIIEKDNNTIQIGDRIKLDQDVWTIYDLNDSNISLTLSNLYKNGSKTYRFDTKSNKYNPESKSSLAEYLNTEFYESLSYKDLLQEKKWFVGEYNDSYKDIEKEEVTAKVGLTSIEDLKFDNDINNYYLLNGTKDGKIYLFNNYLIESKPTLYRTIKPSIYIKRANVKSGSGSLEDPYILEEK